MKRILLTSVLLTIGMLVLAVPLMAGVPSLINYQGRLTNSAGNPLDTMVAMIFSLYGDSTGGSPILADTIGAVAVEKGLFTVTFGKEWGRGDTIQVDSTIFPRPYLGIKIGNDPEITPRTPLTSAPYAFHAAKVDNIDGAQGGTIFGDFAIAPAPSGAKMGMAGTSTVEVGGTYAISLNPPPLGTKPFTGTLKVFNNSLTIPTITLDGLTGKIIMPTGAVAGHVLTSDGSGVGSWASPAAISSDLDWDKLPSPGATEYLQTSGAWGIARAGNTLWGTGRNTHVNLGVGCTSGRSGEDYGWIAIGGGQYNDAIGHFTTIAGGRENKIGNSNTPDGNEARFGAIVGGYNNEVRGTGAFIGGGASNFAYDDYCAVGGGYANLAGLSGLSPTEARFAYIGGGQRNYAQADYSTVGGGFSNQAAGIKSTIAGGDSNYVAAGALSGTISGGHFNAVNDIGATISGGYYNITETSAPYATIGGGRYNRVTDYAGTIAGGELDTVLAEYGTVGGGNEHYINTNAIWGTVAGGNANVITDSGGAILGGQNNSAAGSFAGIGGGKNNQTLGHCSVIPGGNDNRANGRFSLAAGQQAQSLHNGSFVWNDNAAGIFASTANNQFLIHADGGVGIGTNAPGATLRVVGTDQSFFERSGSGMINIISLYNPDLTNGNGVSMNFRADETSISRSKEFATIDVIFTSHNPKSAEFAFFTSNAGGWGERVRIASNGNTGIMTNAPHSTLHDNGSIAVGFQSTAASIVATSSNCIIEGTANLTITLPPAAGITGRIYTIKNTGGVGIIVTVDANGAELIDGALTYPVASMMWVTIVSNGTKWLIIGN
jgi:hypothetical protein